jgi:electron transfer flavoprotein beta subunit
MKMAVLVKTVPDTASVIDVAPDGNSVAVSGGTNVMNPFDEFALEEAVRIREKRGGEVKALSVGDDESLEILRAALAAGADSATLVRNPLTGTTPRGISIALASILKSWEPDLVLAGLKGIDDPGSQVPARTAELMGVGHASSVIETDAGESSIKVTRDMEEERWVCEMAYPALITVQKGINIPRYPTVPDVLKARKKEIDVVTLEDLGVDPELVRPRLNVESVSVFCPSRKKMILEGDLNAQVGILVSMFKEEGHLS